ncbi:hypothetical protein HPB47_007884 [Ixodes persulcatus]|uniref:Uncharacterized protein n=1 Tax=Ixodes persulcatus TaxID=34615 RepID=A0AC60P6E3_IXOPE|nr:hypothetical protein HPB47_007884 [Ixodes persulcatus]
MFRHRHSLSCLRTPPACVGAAALVPSHLGPTLAIMHTAGLIKAETQDTYIKTCIVQNLLAADTYKASAHSKLLNLTKIELEDGKHAIRTYSATPGATPKGMVHGCYDSEVGHRAEACPRRLSIIICPTLGTKLLPETGLETLHDSSTAEGKTVKPRLRTIESWPPLHTTTTFNKIPGLKQSSPSPGRPPKVSQRPETPQRNHRTAYQEQRKQPPRPPKNTPTRRVRRARSLSVPGPREIDTIERHANSQGPAQIVHLHTTPREPNLAAHPATPTLAQIAEILQAKQTQNQTTLARLGNLESRMDTLEVQATAIKAFKRKNAVIPSTGACFKRGTQDSIYATETDEEPDE